LDNEVVPVWRQIPKWAILVAAISSGCLYRFIVNVNGAEMVYVTTGKHVTLVLETVGLVNALLFQQEAQPVLTMDILRIVNVLMVDIIL